MIDIRRLGSAVRHYASLPVAALCLGVLALFITIDYRAVIIPILGATVGALLSIVLLHIHPIEWHSSREWSLPDYRIAGIITSVYTISVIWIYRYSLHERPVAHYLVFGGFAGYIAYEISSGAKHRRILPQVSVLAFLTYWSVQFAFPLGMYNADARGNYIPAIDIALSTGSIRGLTAYLGHLTYALETVLITGLSPKIGYFLLSTLLLTSTLIILASIDHIFPTISTRVALFATLFFACMGWTLSRGFHPGKLASYYGLTLLLGFVAVVQSLSPSNQRQKLWTVLGLLITPALIFGHRFSAGAAMVFLISIVVFDKFSSFVLYEKPKYWRDGSTVAFAAVYVLGVIGNPVHQGPLINRFIKVLISVLIPAGAGGSSAGGGGGGPGRYSTLSLELLSVSTAGQAILFGLGVLGATIAIRRADWEYDLGIFWMGALATLLGMSLVFNAADIQPQRFYALLGLFGLNIFAGFALVSLLNSDIQIATPTTISIVFVLFAVLSLGSPVASMHLSFVSDDVPHARLHETEKSIEGDGWIQQYQDNEANMLNTRAPNTELPYRADSDFRVRVDASQIPMGYRYVYTESAMESGIRTDGGLGLGSRRYVFMNFNPIETDSKLYSNADTIVYVEHGAVTSG